MITVLFGISPLVQNKSQKVIKYFTPFINMYTFLIHVIAYVKTKFTKVKEGQGLGSSCCFVKVKLVGWSVGYRPTHSSEGLV